MVKTTKIQTNGMLALQDSPLDLGLFFEVCLFLTELTNLTASPKIDRVLRAVRAVASLRTSFILRV